VAADGLTATVVGAGTAGLASAVSLAQAGWQVKVLERAPAFGEVGAGLAITGNGMTALTALGMDGPARVALTRQTRPRSCLSDEDGYPIRPQQPTLA
jgi:2-polyprenyl-6-methoxyphenol hydroxylase-like FAD-dependent oxidoreductase